MLSQISFKFPFGKRNHWPNPQESIGAYLADIGGKKCWEATGEARTAFKTLQIEIGEYSKQTCESLSNDVVWSLYMVGPAEEKASPTVTFISTEPGPRQRVRTLIKESKLLDKYPGFITMDIDRPPGCKSSVIKTLGGLEEKSSVSEAVRMEQITISVPSRAFIGTSIYLNEQVQDLVATGGGILQSRGKSYLTSVAHPFEKCWNDRFPQATTPGDYVFEIDEISDSDEEDEAIADITSGGSVTSNSVPCDASDRSPNSESDAWSSKQGLLESLLPLPNQKMATGLPSSLVQANTVLSQRRNHNQMSSDESQEQHGDGGGISTQVDEQSPPGLPGATTTASMPALAQDEPLIYNLSGPIISSARGGTVSLDYSLFELPNVILQESEYSLSEKSLHWSPSSAPREPRSTEVVVHTASGPVAGRLLATPSFMQSAQGMLPQQLWTVIMEGTLQRGLCGSWVMDVCSGDVFGHIIAGAPEDGFAYMIPFFEILDDLNTNFGGDWTFAERPTVAQSRDHESIISSNSQMGGQNIDTDARRGHPSAELLNRLCKSHSTQDLTIDLGDNSDTNPIENYKAWITSNSLFAAGSSGSDRCFIPQEKLQQFFNPTSKVDNLRNLLSVCGISVDIDVETIRESFVKVFSILLMINKASYIKAFILRDDLSDSSLPFGPGNERILEDEERKSFYDAFVHAQWQFCAPVFHFQMETRFDEHLILPFTKKEKLHDGGMAAVYKIEMHPYYNALKPGKEKQSTENTFALKTYSPGVYSKRMFENEIAAFQRLSKSATTEGSIIGYYGTYTQSETYNIILEYADKGDLESFFQHENPPSETANIVEFWKSMFSIAKALKVMHNLDSGDSDTGGADVFSGWHQDLKPSNILVTTHGNDQFCHQFKLADLGLSHFKAKVAHGGAPVTQWDQGTGTYGAPECYRPHFSSPKSMPRAEQNCDIWSLGCILSEAAIWVAHGGRGLEKYRQLRADELNRLGRGGDDCFHDGEKVLDSVQAHLKTLRDWSTRTDPLTSHILDVVDSMLLESSKRLDANSVHSELEHAFQRWRNNFDFSRNAADSDASLAAPRNQISTTTAQLEMAAAEIDPIDIPIVEPAFDRKSAANDADSTDDSDAPNEYSFIVEVADRDGHSRAIWAAVDTGANTNFISRSALDKLGIFEERPIPRGKLEAFRNPLDSGKKVTPAFVLLRLSNREIGLQEDVRLKVFELSEGTNGYDIILGRETIRKHGGHRFLKKVEGTSSGDPHLAGTGDNLLFTLLRSQRTKEKILLDQQNVKKFHGQNEAKASNLYASSGIGSQSFAVGTWSETTGRFQDPTARTGGTTAWNPSAQPNGSSFYDSTRAGQQRPDHNAPLRGLQSNPTRSRSNSNDYHTTQSSDRYSRQSPELPRYRPARVSQHRQLWRESAERVTDYLAPGSCTPSDVPKQNNE
ncbi:hypothetical protein BGZ57DRAFT_858249 [Hyaloscypha finlandica]|nr:hypothetical protein BGZ57DRAFT_858249 [Hyaloscypha finlandica]